MLPPSAAAGFDQAWIGSILLFQVTIPSISSCIDDLDSIPFLYAMPSSTSVSMTLIYVMFVSACRMDEPNTEMGEPTVELKAIKFDLLSSTDMVSFYLLCIHKFYLRKYVKVKLTAISRKSLVAPPL